MRSKLFNLRCWRVCEKNFVDNAWNEGRRLVAWGMHSDYKKLDQAGIKAQLDEFKKCLNGFGLVELVQGDDENMPRDYYIGVKLKSSYVAAAVLVHAYNEFPELFEDAEYLEMLRKVLKGCLQRNFRDHGYEAEEGKIQNLLIIAKGGIGKFIDNHPEGVEQFCSTVAKEIKVMRSAYAKYGKFATVDGFEPVVVGGEIKKILEAYQNA